jgi:hypothetical protein
LRRLGIEVAGTVINRHATPPAPYGAYDYTHPTSPESAARRKSRRATVGAAPES